MIVEEDKLDKLDKLDDSWIQDFDKVDKPYQDFYKENVYYVNINIFYVNKENEIDKITNEIFLMKNHNVISREEIIDIIKRNSCYNKNLYSLLSILKYNITVNPEEVTYFLDIKDYDFIDRYRQFLTILQHIDTIVFEPTISMFQDLNNLIIIFYEKNEKYKNNYTKKIYFKRNKISKKYNNTVRNL
uniref:Uncharacterized protein n=1 Tax=viral metagenome TaxID=1070528 RepID=A0A6C0DTU6_9ZZZZ